MSKLWHRGPGMPRTDGQEPALAFAAEPDA